MTIFFTDERVKVERPGMLFIGGSWVASSCDSTLHLVSPSDETHFGNVAQAGILEIDRAVSAARAAFDTGPWPRMSVVERADRLTAFGAELQKRANELSACWSLQTGIPTSVANLGLAHPRTLYDYYAALISERPSVESHPRDRGGFAIVARDPVGVIAAVAPWNHPFHLMSLKVAPALAMGCTVIAKPAPEAPLDVFIMAECAQAAGLPEGVFNIAPADGGASDYLIRHPGIDKVSFTGSAATGKQIAAACGERMARSSMELGGKSAAILLDDISIEAVMKTLVRANGFHMAGQGCAFLTRVLVSKGRRDELVDAYLAALKSIKVGHAFDPSTQMGPIAMRRQRDKVEHNVAQGVAEGAQLVVGGKRPPHLPKGFYLEPTLFVNVTRQMTIAREEIFGPVICVLTYEDEEEAINIANDSDYGLNGVVYTDDVEKAYSIARRVRAGNFAHNGLEHDGKFPFGGYKQSGIGREGGEYGLDLYTEIKTIYMANPPAMLAR
jgi:aldehyde dehydrogenase (NAD+)